MMAATNEKAKSGFSGRRVRGYQRPMIDQYLFHPALREGRFSLYDVPAMVTDSAVSIGLNTIYGPLFGAQFEIRANSKEIKTFVENTIYRFWHHDLMKVLQHYVPMGTFAGEVMYERDPDSGLWRYAGVDDFDPRDAQPWKRGRNMTKMRVAPGGAGVPLMTINRDGEDPTEWNVVRPPKVLWVAHRPTCGQLRGHSALEASWGPWMEKCGSHGAISIRRLWAFSNAYRGCLVKYPIGSTTRSNGDVVDNQDIARELAENYCTGGALFCPSGTDEQGHPLWEIVDPKLNGEIKGLMEYPDALSRDIWQGMGILDEVIHAPDTGGSWSGRSGPLLIFLNIEDMRVREIITGFDVGPSGYTTRNEESGGVIRPLVMENFGPKAKYEIRTISLVPKPAEPGAGGTPPGSGETPGGGPGGMPPDQGGGSPMGAPPGQMDVPTQPAGGNPIKLSGGDDGAVDLPDAEVEAILREAARTVSLRNEVALSTAEPSSDTEDLANLYAEAWRGLTPEQVGKKELDTVHAELANGEWHLQWDEKTGWTVVHTSDGANVQLSTKHAPKGGIVIAGKPFKGGMFIPNADYAKATPEEKAAIDNPKQASADARQAKGSVDHDSLKAKLTPHSHHELTKQEMTSAKRSFNALHRHHGDLVVHRLEEIADMLQAAHDREGNTEGQTEQFSRRLKAVEHQIEMARGKGVTGEVAAKAAQKEPWQLTKDEWMQSGFDPSYPRPKGAKVLSDTEHAREQWPQVHERAVSRALEAGLPVPPEVLSEYSDLAKDAKPAPTNVQAKQTAEQLPGGKADNKPDADFAKEALAKGAKVESEHTNDSAKAKEIAKDHLAEDPKYYDKLAKMEGDAATEPEPAKISPVDYPAVAKRIHEAGQSLLSNFGYKSDHPGALAHKVFISDLYDAVKDDLDGDVTLTDFKKMVVEMSQKGHLEIGRQDMVGGPEDPNMPRSWAGIREKVEDSEARHPVAKEATFHHVTIPKESSAKETPAGPDRADQAGKAKEPRKINWAKATQAEVDEALWGAKGSDNTVAEPPSSADPATAGGDGQGAGKGKEPQVAIEIGDRVAAQTIGGEVHSGILDDIDNGTAIIRKPDGSAHASGIEALRQPSPHEMTKEEFVDAHWPDQKEHRMVAELTKRGMHENAEKVARTEARFAHAKQVMQAVMDGKVVPEHVIKDYPELDSKVMGPMFKEIAGKMDAARDEREGLKAARVKRKKDFDEALNGDKRRRQAELDRASAQPLAAYLADLGVSDDTIAKVMAGKPSASGYRIDAETGSNISLPSAAGNYYRTHREAVMSAISSGKPVPSEVLADYPDLQAKYGAAGKATATQGGDAKPAGSGNPEKSSPQSDNTLDLPRKDDSIPSTAANEAAKGSESKGDKMAKQFDVNKKYKLIASGDTKPVKDALKAKGWKWDAEKQHWYQMLVGAHAQLVADGDDVFFRGLGGHKKGVQISLDGDPVWTSKTYQSPGQATAGAGTPGVKRIQKNSSVRGVDAYQVGGIVSDGGKDYVVTSSSRSMDDQGGYVYDMAVRPLSDGEQKTHEIAKLRKKLSTMLGGPDDDLARQQHDDAVKELKLEISKLEGGALSQTDSDWLNDRKEKENSRIAFENSPEQVQKRKAEADHLRKQAEENRFRYRAEREEREKAEREQAQKLLKPDAETIAVLKTMMTGTRMKDELRENPLTKPYADAIDRQHIKADDIVDLIFALRRAK